MPQHATPCSILCTITSRHIADNSYARPPRPLHKVFLLMLIGLASIGCEDTSNKQKPTFTRDPSITMPDLGTIDMPIDPTPEIFSTFCTPNTRRCLGANSPLYEQCSTDGRVFEGGSCLPGEMCRDGQCTPFSCFPGRALCVGAKSTAVCAPTGQDIEQPQECPDNTVCRAGFCVDLCEEARQSQSYIGCEYLAHELFNFYRVDVTEPDSPYAIIVANTLPLTSATINLVHAQTDMPASLFRSKTLQSEQDSQIGQTTVKSAILQGKSRLKILEGDATNIEIPPSSAAVLLVKTESGRPDSFALRSTQPVVAYQFSPYCCNFTATNDASLLLPTSTLQDTYRVLNYPSWSPTGSTETVHPYIYVTATEDNTVVDINSPILLENGVRALGMDPGDPKDSWTIRLNRGETQILSAAVAGDMSGTLVRASAPVSVFAGHPCTFVPYDKWACDHLEEQLFPAATLGKTYLLQHFKQRNFANASSMTQEEVFWRIVAHEDSEITFEPKFDNLTVSSPSTPHTGGCATLVKNNTLTLKAGETCEFGTREPLAIQSTGNLIVGGVFSGHESTGINKYGAQAGDPAMFLLPPSEQFRRDYTFVTPPTFKKTFAAIVVPDDIKVALNNRQISSSNQLERQTITVDGQKWRMFSVELQPGVHTLRAQEDFGVVVYAYDDYVSYAFPGGLDLRPRIKE